MLLVLLFGCEDHRGTTLVMGEPCLLHVPFIWGLSLHLLHLSPSVEKAEGHLETWPNTLLSCLMGDVLQQADHFIVD